MTQQFTPRYFPKRTESMWPQNDLYSIWIALLWMIVKRWIKYNFSNGKGEPLIQAKHGWSSETLLSVKEARHTQEYLIHDVTGVNSGAHNTHLWRNKAGQGWPRWCRGWGAAWKTRTVGLAGWIQMCCTLSLVVFTQVNTFIKYHLSERYRHFIWIQSIHTWKKGESFSHMGNIWAHFSCLNFLFCKVELIYPSVFHSFGKMDWIM